MLNELIKIGPVVIHSYGAMIAIGVLVAFAVAEFRVKRINLDSKQIFSLSIWCLIGGMLGAKLLYYITQIERIISNPSVLLSISDGFVVCGGIIGGIFTGFLYCKKYKMNFLQYFDLLIPSVALAQAFGRIGCFMAGCCYGMETSNWFGVEFPTSSLAPHDIRLIPTQLISSILDFLLFVALIIFAKRKKFDGQVATLYLILYSGGRFALEFFRGDLIRGNVGVLSTSQFIALFLFVIGCFVFSTKVYKGKIH